MSHPRIRGFDGLRAIAVLLVFFWHRLPQGTINSGGYGVRLFFVLSGFLIIGGLARDRLKGTRSSWGRDIAYFYIKRTLRIFPIYYLVIATATYLTLSGLVTVVTTDELAWHASYTTNFYQGRVVERWLPAFGHLWSLSVEEQFYMIAAPLVILARGWRIDKICLALTGAAALWFGLQSAIGASKIAIYTDSVINFGIIAIGGFLATSSASWLERIKAIEPAIWLLAYFWSLVILGLIGSPLVLEFLTAFIAGGLVLSVSANQHSPLVDRLEGRFLASLGQISYGFYLYHYFITSANLRWATGGLLNLEGLPLLPLTIVLFAITYGISRISWMVVEQPALAFKNRLVSKRNEPKSAEDLLVSACN